MRRYSVFATLCAAAVAALAWWLLSVPVVQPEPFSESLFQGVRYIREVTGEPRPMVIHVVKVDLSAPGVSVMVTPPVDSPPVVDGKTMPLVARKTTAFLDEFALQLAVNGGYFEPFREGDYPRAGNPVASWGFAASVGKVYGKTRRADRVLHVSPDGRAGFGEVDWEPFNAMEGDVLLVRRGEALDRSAGKLHPRTAVGIDRGGRALIFVVIDGRNSGVSEGATLAETGRVLLRHGAWGAVSLDGGGSSALAVRGSGGGAELLNTPVDGRVPGQERVVGTHIGIFAAGAETGGGEESEGGR